ncbi:MAG: hypothetical protein E5299_02123 [Burkholderia gladioli]|nr:MAG: hypothetical protein E5299_02123 [Burkholderia gladioli]
MYRFKTLTGNCLPARQIDLQATAVACKSGFITRMGWTSLVRNPFVSTEIMPVGCYCVLTLDLCNNANLKCKTFTNRWCCIKRAKAR